MEYPLIKCTRMLLLLGMVMIELKSYGSLGCLEDERAGLMKLKDAFDDPTGSSALSSWGGGEERDCCKWERVVCDNATKRISRLSLGYVRDFHNVWSLDASLFLHFQELQNLSLAHDALTGFRGVLNLSKLEVLDLSSNSFTEIPSLNAMQSLRSLNLGTNDLSNSHRFKGKPRLYRLGSSLCCMYLYIAKLTHKTLVILLCCTELTNLTNLEMLHLGSNGLMEIPSSIWALTSLKALSLRNNGLNGLLPLRGFKGLLNLSKLEVLDLSSNSFTEIPSLSAMQSLRSLNLRNNDLNNSHRFKGKPRLYRLCISLCCMYLYIAKLTHNTLAILLHFTELTNLTNLEMLHLGDNALMEIPSPIWALTSLKALSLRYNGLNGLLPLRGLCKLVNLQELDLSNNGFKGNLPSCLMNFTSLRLLELSQNRFEGAIPSTFFPILKSLEYISLSHNLFEGSFSFSSLANNSNLLVFELVSDNNGLKVDTENPPWTPLSQLKVFRLSNCKLNDESRVLPSFLLNQFELREIDLSHNSIPGRIPMWLVANNTRLEILNLANNSLTGPLILDLNSTHLDMFWFDISSNHIQGELPSLIGSAFPNLSNLNMSRNLFQGSIPPSLGDLRSLYTLDLSDNNFSGQLPEHLVTGCVSLIMLKLSKNSLQGQFLPSKSNLTKLGSLYLDSNFFSGEIPRGILNSSGLWMLDLSDNLFSGKIPDWIGDLPLISLALSKNALEGPIPSSFCKSNGLSFLDLSWNNLRDGVPSCLNPSSLRFLHLQGNEFSGPLPSFLSSLFASSLVTLDVRDNKLSGEIPGWINSFSNLRVLLLGGNSFEGPIPLQLCDLGNISIIDLSRNELSGPIPSCLHGIKVGYRKAFDDTFRTEIYEALMNMPLYSYSYENQLDVNKFIGPPIYMSDVQEEVEFMTKSRSETYKGNILYFMSGIDLSCNKLTGPVPYEIGYLSDIHALNLSHNHLTGPIPESFSNLRQIESLDLSHNSLSGEIPPKLVELNYLSVFTVAYNNLSGRTPEREAQFATFDEHSYEGNSLMCGLPLERRCITDEEMSPPPQPSYAVQDDTFKVAFLATFWPTYAVAFVGIVVILYFCPYHEYLISMYYFLRGIVCKQVIFSTSC
ncbi:hypothetical protein RJ639_015193, partial [Escallonia herrerae]